MDDDSVSCELNLADLDLVAGGMEAGRKQEREEKAWQKIKGLFGTGGTLPDVVQD